MINVPVDSFSIRKTSDTVYLFSKASLVKAGAIEDIRVCSNRWIEVIFAARHRSGETFLGVERKLTLSNRGIRP